MLVDGITTNLTGGALPIIAITEAAHFLTGILSGTDNIELDNFFAHFRPMQGSTLVDQQIGTYPLANQTVAGNAVIRQPLTLSMEMICPARDVLGYPLKLMTMTALKQVLDQHNAMGGTYIVATPAGLYTDGVMLGLRDISDQGSVQPQNRYQWDFFFPILTVQTAQQVQGSLISKLTNGSQINGTPAWTSPENAVANPSSLAITSTVPATGGLTAATAIPIGGG
jgi:hypothetical protein